MTKDKLNFIVIDDSKLDCFIAEKIIQNTGKCNSVKTFQQASEAITYISGLPEQTHETILFVDIQMPVMNGFEFVEAFEALPAEKKNGISIYMLSSSINENDIARVKGYASIRQFINKPLTAGSIAIILENF